MTKKKTRKKQRNFPDILTTCWVLPASDCVFWKSWLFSSSAKNPLTLKVLIIEAVKILKALNDSSTFSPRLPEASSKKLPEPLFPLHILTFLTFDFDFKLEGLVTIWINFSFIWTTYFYIFLTYIWHLILIISD